jgi:hypothetical protein
MTAVYLALAMALFYTSFCRLVMVDRETVPVIRIAFYAQAVAAAGAAFSILFWGHRPEIPDILVMGSMVCVQVTTSRLWRDGVPVQYRQRP